MCVPYSVYIHTCTCNLCVWKMGQRERVSTYCICMHVFFHLLDFVRFKYFVNLTLCVFALMLVRLTACKFVRVCARDGESERKP